MPAREMSPIPWPGDRPRRAWLGILVLAWGIQAIVTQSILLREALVLMFGSEFAWGVILFAWLLGVAIGGTLGGVVADRLRRADLGLVIVLLALSLGAVVELWVFRGARAWLGVQPGELLPLPKTALAAMLFVSPVSALVGMAFPLACCVTGVRRSPAQADPGPPPASTPAVRGLLQLGNIYALESAGSLIGGAAFSFWAVEHLSPIQTVLFCGAITAAASAGLLFLTARRPYAPACLALLAGWILVTAILAGEGLNRRLVERRWQDVAPGYELCAEAESKYQNLAVGRRLEQYTLYCDGQVTVDFPDPYSFAPLAHFWMSQHPSPRRVLVLGGGAEGLLAEILLHPVEHVDYVEPDPRLIKLVEPYLAGVDRAALGDERVTVHNLDARYFVKTQRERFDLVIARLPEPMSALRARLYTDEFYGELRRAMTPRAVLCLTAAAAPGQLSAASAEYLASIRATLERHFPHVTVGWGHPAQVLAATAPGLTSTDPAELAQRYTQRGAESKLFDPAWFDGATDWLDPVKLERRAADLDDTATVQVSTDLRPIVYLQRLILWERMTGGRSGGVIEWLHSVGWGQLIGVMVAMTAVTLFGSYVRTRMSRTRADAPDRPDAPEGPGGSAGSSARSEISWRVPPPSPLTKGGKRGVKTPRGRRNCSSGRADWLTNGAIVLSVATTGFATMALSLIWLFAFQNLYGYVYQRIGWIIAIFMGGLVVGCALAGRRGPDGPPAARSAYFWRWLIGVDVLLAMLALTIPFLLPALGRLQSTPFTFTLVEWCVSIMVALTGVLGGAAFALAAGLQLQITGRAGPAAGTIVGADHAGACLGALLSGILLVPVFGTAAAAFLLAALKLASATLLLAGRPRNAPRPETEPRP